MEKGEKIEAEAFFSFKSAFEAEILVICVYEKTSV